MQNIPIFLSDASIAPRLAGMKPIIYQEEEDSNQPLEVTYLRTWKPYPRSLLSFLLKGARP